MRSGSVALKAHFAQSYTTIARCWKVTRRDGNVYGFTNHDRRLEISGVTYLATSGFSGYAIQSQAGLAVDNTEVDGAFASSVLTAADLRAGLWDFAAVEVFDVNWADLSMGVLKQPGGVLGRVSAGRLSFNAELVGLTKFFDQEVGRLYGYSCDADLGDARCKFVLDTAPFMVTGTITAVTDRRRFTDSGRGEAAAYYDFGKITFDTGANADLANEVKTFASGGAITLQLPMPYTVQIGDTYTLTTGCDKDLATCRDKFDNVDNFRGYPWIPGPDQLLSGEA